MQGGNQSAAHSALVNDCLIWPSAQRGCMAWKNHTGVAKIDGRVMRFGMPGRADILFCWCGRAGAVECKTGAGKLTTHQLNWSVAWQAAGGIYILARHVSALPIVLHDLAPLP